MTNNILKSIYYKKYISHLDNLDQNIIDEAFRQEHNELKSEIAALTKNGFSEIPVVRSTLNRAARTSIDNASVQELSRILADLKDLFSVYTQCLALGIDRTDAQGFCDTSGGSQIQQHVRNLSKNLLYVAKQKPSNWKKLDSAGRCLPPWSRPSQSGCFLDPDTQDCWISEMHAGKTALNKNRISADVFASELNSGVFCARDTWEVPGRLDLISLSKKRSSLPSCLQVSGGVWTQYKDAVGRAQIFDFDTGNRTLTSSDSLAAVFLIARK